MKKLVWLLLGVCMIAMPADSLKEFPRYDGEHLMPRPKIVSLSAERVDLSSFSLEGVGLAEHHCFLSQWLMDRGGRRCQSGGVSIVLGLGEVDGVKAPDRREGYSLEIGRKRIRIAGHDRRGVLWGLSTLVQLTEPKSGALLVRMGKVTDWPDELYRGSIFPDSRPLMDYLRFNAVFKLNAFTNQFGCLYRGAKNNDWMFQEPPKAFYRTLELYRMAVSLGFEVGIYLYSPYDKRFAASDPHTYERLMKWVRPLAQAGLRIYVMFDDVHFPLHPLDAQRFKTAAELDVWLLNRLVKDVRCINPQSGVDFCPPFYWGPDFDPSLQYGENREQYLRTLGRKLDSSIRVYTTGKAVFGGIVKKSDIDWFQERVGKRRLLFFNNSKDSSHVYGYHFATDPVSVWGKHYADLYSDVDFQDTGLLKPHFAYLASRSDYLWHKQGYDPVSSPLSASAKVAGREHLALLQEMNVCMSVFDSTEWKVSPGAARDLPRLRAANARLVRCLAQARERGIADMLDYWLFFADGQRFFQRFIGELEQGKFSLPEGTVERIYRDITKETRWVKGTGAVLLPYDFSGGIRPEIYRFRQSDERYCTGVRGKGSHVPLMTAGFRFPNLEGRIYTMYICGQDDEQKGQCQVRISLNGTVVFAGDNPFQPFVWSVWRLPLPQGCLKEGDNLLRIEGIDNNGSNVGGSFMLVNYVAIF